MNIFIRIIFFCSGDWSSSIQYYQEALRVDAECSEALYNLGIACKRVDRKEDALESFIKLHQIQRTNPQVMFMIADVYRLMGDNSAAVEWLQQALSVSHNDPKLLQELGAIFDNEGDKSSAFQVLQKIIFFSIFLSTTTTRINFILVISARLNG